MIRELVLSSCIALNISIGCLGATGHHQSATGDVSGVTRDTAGNALAQTQVVLHSVEDNSERSATTDANGFFLMEGVKPGHYTLSATKEGFASSSLAAVDIARGQTVHADLMLQAVTSHPATHDISSEGFFRRLADAYIQDWKGTAEPGPPVPFRGDPAPEDSPPYPFTIWPFGGSPVIGQPWTNSYPLMEALWSGPHGEAWKASGIQIYGWLNFGFNVSTSDRPGYNNYPEAYDERSNSIQPDQEVLYIERQPDTVQTDHVDWGFRLSNLYGIDYRFTTAKGIFSNQLLGKNQEYGYDPVMAYFDVYVPNIAQGMDIRIGRYISLPDIEAQLAPNNYTYSHSLLYTFDCYTQTGINTTTKLSDHWMVQVGFSPGCDAAPWTKDAKATLNFCIGYTWRQGADNIYTCDNSLNSGKYAYNNLQAFYTTWYHKFNSRWHSSTEAWYQYEREVPNVTDPAAPPPETNANGAICNTTTQPTCYAPEWAVVNYLERQFSKKDYLTIRNEYFDDMKGQRTGFRTKYTEHLVGWGHWIGTTVLFRPELRFERSYDVAAYDDGTKKNQLTLAGDVIYFF
jgi:hypothetical protein